MKPIRSVLYTPGHKRQLIDKAHTFGADALCLVVEDSVPEAAKREAREIIKESIPQLKGRGQTVLVKINSLDSDHVQRDLSWIVQPGLSGVIVPESRTPQDAVRVGALLAAAEIANGVVGGSVEIMLLIETASGVRSAYELATATPRTTVLISGHGANGDMARELGYRWTDEGLERLYIRSKVIVDARAAGCHPMDGAFMRVDDLEGFVREAEFSRQLGYRGKLAVAPRQVAAINKTFTPTEREIEYYQKVVDAFDKALTEGSSSFLVDGTFIDYAPYETAKAAIEFAKMVGTRTDR